MALPELKEFCMPATADEVASLLEKYGDAALFVAGGTFVHGLEARGFLPGVEALIDLRKLGLDKIEKGRKGVTVGASVKFAALDGLSNLDAPAYGALHDALSYPPTQIMNLATIGGCIAASCPFYDVPAAFLALDGVVTVQGTNSSRELSIGDVYAGLFENSLEADEYISGLFLPKQDSGTSGAYIKLETNANDLALVGVAARITVGRKNKISDARVVLGGGLNDTHTRSAAAEAVLNGQQASDALFQKAADAIDADISPISDHRCSAEYRGAIGKVYVKRTLRQALQRLD